MQCHRDPLFIPCHYKICITLKRPISFRYGQSSQLKQKKTHTAETAAVETVTEQLTWSIMIRGEGKELSSCLMNG